MKKLFNLLRNVSLVLVLLVVAALMFGGGSSDEKADSSSAKEEAAATQEAKTEEKSESKKSKKDKEKEAAAEKEAEEEPATEEEPAEEPEPVEYLNVDCDTMFQTLEDNALNAKRTYEGKPVRLTGVLKVIDASGDYFALGNSDEWSFSTIHCSIEDEATLDRIASASIGDTLVVCGTVDSVGEILGYSMTVDYIE